MPGKKTFDTPEATPVPLPADDSSLVYKGNANVARLPAPLAARGLCGAQLKNKFSPNRDSHGSEASEMMNENCCPRFRSNLSSAVTIWQFSRSAKAT